jgi:hypothetical protein
VVPEAISSESAVLAGDALTPRCAGDDDVRVAAAVAVAKSCA